MENLFTEELNYKGKQVSYTVSFHDDAYHFLPSDSNAPNFSIKRERDEWMTNDEVDERTLNAATSALDKYLLSQH